MRCPLSVALTIIGTIVFLGNNVYVEMGGQHHGMDRPGIRQVPERSGELGKMEKTGCKITCGAPTTFAVKG